MDQWRINVEMIELMKDQCRDDWINEGSMYTVDDWINEGSM